MPKDKPPRLPKSAPRVHLSIVSGPGAGHSVALTRCASLIGSRAGCKIQLKSSDVSPVHCAIVNTGEQILLRDLASTTGTYLNSLRAEMEELEDGDTIRVGDWELRVKITAYSLDTLSDLPHVSLEPEPTAFGVQLNGSATLVKLERPVSVVGRREGCDVILQHREISRVHLLLFTFSGQPVFFDLLSHNGVALEGERMRFGVLHSGDHLQIGPQRVRLILPGIGRRPPGGSGSHASMDSGEQSGVIVSPTMNGSGDGTVVPVEDDGSDRIDVRAAEIDR